MNGRKVTVIGSINMDLVTSTNQIPKVGETVLGNSFHSIPGGKGANQAVAAARLGADVTMIAAVGNDSFGKTLVEHLTNEGINTENIIKVKDTSTGIASIIVSEADNSIIVVPGANNHVTPEVIEKHENKIINSDIILLQLEISVESVIKAVELAKKHGVRTILNPAPIQKLPKELLEMVDYLTPNEHEQALLFDSIGGTEEELAKYKEKCIVTKGSKGVMIYKNGEKIEIPSFQVEAVDTTGAGDSFNGALAVALCDGLEIEEACRFANVVGAISVTKLGAQTGMPTKKKLKNFYKYINHLKWSEF
ncbi:ribokinase [Neobacillus sp. 179-C4.2 HS]|uniref:Ribokinase n=1 Tax=Neobacillus driksii TaxID=3035913 RepID=A0ABV4YQ93_9BACI|nr:ribokinase [Neobacillus sp. 179.-C4.2 HS]MDP5195626.1 ribokinase [Neobacillus sp. 179.-C4.2 HS]